MGEFESLCELESEATVYVSTFNFVQTLPNVALGYVKSEGPFTISFVKYTNLLWLHNRRSVA